MQTQTSNKKKAVALISGGLDSMLAARLVLDQGVYVEGINFFTGFCVEGHTQAIRKKDRTRAKRNNALWVAEQLGIRLHIVDIVEEYKRVLRAPRHGFGANLNPCLDCKIFMVRRAVEWMQAHSFDFIVTGEVIGQRPMSQRKATMPLVANESEAGELLVRPLSAKNLAETLPEQLGWLDRSLLKDFSGRNRKPQIALAKQYGFHDYAQPAGGCCFLTDPNYVRKLQDLWTIRSAIDYELDDIILLKVGRHIRPNSRFKLIVAREASEVAFLRGYRKQYPCLLTTTHPGPLALLIGEPDLDDVELAGRIVARYSQGRDEQRVGVAYRAPDRDETSFEVLPLQPSEIPHSWIL